MKAFIAYASLLALLSMASCEIDPNYEPKVVKRFDSNLRGTWVSNDPDIYSGTLVISTDRIIITGYSERQTPSEWHDSRRPFKGFTKGASLKGYSEEGKIFIEDGGLLQEGISYTYYTAGSYSDEKYLRFTFGDRVETLQMEQFTW